MDRKYKEIIEFSSSLHNNKDVNGWTTLHEFDKSSKNKAFDARVYKQKDRIVIVFAGTNMNSLNDIKNDLNIMYFMNIPSQFGDAERLYNQVKSKYPNAKIEAMGYSLGGSIANLLAHRTGIKSTALAPIGSKHIANAYPQYFKYGDANIITYGRKGDALFYNNIDNQSGNIYIIPDLPKSFSNEFSAQHLLHNYTEYNIYQAKPYNRGQKTGFAAPLDNISEIFTPEEIGRMSADEFFQNEKAIMQQLRNGKIGRKIQNYAGYKNPLTGNGKIFSREDISAMSGEEYLRHENAIMSQLKEIGIPSSSELETSSLYTGGTVYVRPYVRDDGTKVRGYWRSLPD